MKARIEVPDAARKLQDGIQELNDSVTNNNSPRVTQASPRSAIEQGQTALAQELAALVRKHVGPGFGGRVTLYLKSGEAGDLVVIGSLVRDPYPGRHAID